VAQTKADHVRFAAVVNCELFKRPLSKNLVLFSRQLPIFLQSCKLQYNTRTYAKLNFKKQQSSVFELHSQKNPYSKSVFEKYVFPLVKCRPTGRYVQNGPLIILVLDWCKLIHVSRTYEQKRFLHFLYQGPCRQTDRRT